MTHHTCVECSAHLSVGTNWTAGFLKRSIYYCNPCYNVKFNANQMRVNGKYVSKKHPLWKAGKFIIDGFFGEAKVENDTAKRGYVYCITNPAWPGWVKVGKAVADGKRLNGYQTYSPFRDYTMEWSVEVEDVHAVEAEFHRGRKADNGEWYEMSVEEAHRLVLSIPQVGAKDA